MQMTYYDDEKVDDLRRVPFDIKDEWVCNCHRRSDDNNNLCTASDVATEQAEETHGRDQMNDQTRQWRFPSRPVGCPELVS